MSPGAKTNITYVSMLVFDPKDRISPKQRIEWLLPMIRSGIPLHLFVDDFYLREIGEHPELSNPTHPDLHVRSWSFEHSETWVLCSSAAPNHPLGLPEHRNPAKDTEFFMALMHAKAELVAAVAAVAETPFVAFLDAGIHKIFKDPEASWKRLAGLRIRGGLRGVLLPGCWPPGPVAHRTLAAQISWIFCGGFFVVPKGQAGEFWDWQVAGLRRFLAESRITWEVNTWVECLSVATADPDLRFHWFSADHNDRMVNVPGEFCE